MKKDEPSITNGETGRIFYGWWVVAAAFLNLFFVVGIIFYGFPVFYASFVDSLGFSRAQVTQGFFLGFLIIGLPLGLLAGAVIDCYEKEPLNGPHELFTTPNLIMTPHMSGVYEGFWDIFVGLLAENLRRFHTGAPLLNPVNHRLGY